MGSILVTGGTGFIGSALVRHLAALGHPVRVFDNNFRGRTGNLDPVMDRIELVQGDIRNPDDALRAAEGCDTVYHLAFINGTEYFYSMPQLVLDVGVRGHLTMMDACARAGVGAFIYASSSEVYQTPPVIPTPEDVPGSVPDVTNPRYSYGGSKLMGELLTLHYALEHSMRRVIFRPHNVYGPAMGFEHVIPQLARKMFAATNRLSSSSASIEIQGDGGQTRAFCHVDDAVRGIVLAAERGEDRGIYHVGTDTETTIKELAEAMAAHLGIELDLVPGELPAGGTLRRCPDISRLRGLGYAPQVALAQGLGPTLDWYMNHFATENGD